MKAEDVDNIMENITEDYNLQIIRDALLCYEESEQTRWL